MDSWFEKVLFELNWEKKILRHLHPAAWSMLSVLKPCKALEKVTVSMGVSLSISASELLFIHSNKSTVSLISVAVIDSLSSHVT